VYPFTGSQVQRRMRVCDVLLLAAALVLAIGISLRAQSAEGDAPRHVKSAVKPEYPLLARQMKLSGAVRVEIVIAPDGKVKHTRVVGGHPLLANEAEKAALMMRFEAAPKETTQVIEFRFEP